MTEKFFENNIPDPIDVEIEKEKIERADYENKLIEGKFIDSCEYYEGPKDYRKESFLHLPETVQVYPEILIKLLYCPILRDSLEEVFDNNGKRVEGRRAHLKEEVEKKGLGEKEFYASNRLEASNIQNVFSMLNYIDEQLPFSPEVKHEIQETLAVFSFEKKDESPSGYFKMSNEEKYQFVVGPVTQMIENALDELLAKKESQ